MARQVIGDGRNRNEETWKHECDRPMFSASPEPAMDWKAMPTHSPARLNTGPPELPELIAASICTPSSSVDPCT